MVDLHTVYDTLVIDTDLKFFTNPINKTWSR